MFILFYSYLRTERKRKQAIIHEYRVNFIMVGRPVSLKKVIVRCVKKINRFVYELKTNKRGNNHLWVLNVIRFAIKTTY